MFDADEPKLDPFVAFGGLDLRRALPEYLAGDIDRDDLVLCARVSRALKHRLEEFLSRNSSCLWRISLCRAYGGGYDPQ